MIVVEKQESLVTSPTIASDTPAASDLINTHRHTISPHYSTINGSTVYITRSVR